MVEEFKLSSSDSDYRIRCHGVKVHLPCRRLLLLTCKLRLTVPEPEPLHPALQARIIPISNLPARTSQDTFYRIQSPGKNISPLCYSISSVNLCLVQVLSGGNRRKLSAALALAGGRDHHFPLEVSGLFLWNGGREYAQTCRDGIDVLVQEFRVSGYRLISIGQVLRGWQGDADWLRPWESCLLFEGTSGRAYVV